MRGRELRIRAIPLVFAGCLVLPAASARGQAPAAPAEARAGLGGERAIARYKQSLGTHPVEGTALDRVWNFALENGATAALLDEYAAQSGTNLSAALVHGHLLKKAGRPEDAAVAYQRAAALAPADPRPWLALAELEKQRSQPLAAAAALDSALPLLPADDPRRRDALLALGSAHLAAGDIAHATEAWEKTVLAAPRDPSVRQRLAEAYEKNGLPERAVPHQEWIEQHAADPAARALAARALGRLHEARDHFDEARAALERARNLTAPGNWLRADTQTALVRLHERAGRLPELEASWRTAAEKSPRDLGAWLSLVELYAATGERERERAALERATALVPRDRELSLRLARLCAEMGDLDRAAATFDGLLKNQPSNLDFVLERAQLDVRAGRLAEAAARVQEAVERSQPGDQAVAGAALAFFQANRLHEATERALRADITRRPDAPEPALALATFLFNAKRTTEALAALDAFANPPPGTASTDAAAEAERCALAAGLCKEQNRLEDATRYAQRAVAAQPENSGHRLALGDLLLLRGEAAAARAEFLVVADAPATASELRETAEQKLFAACSALPPGAGPATMTPKRSLLPPKTGTLLGPPVVMRADRRLHVGVSPLRIPPRGGIGRSLVPEEESSAVLERVAELEAATEAEPTAANFLRLARWQSWRRALPEALAAAQAAAKAEPTSVSAQEWVVRLATGSRERAVAAAGLATLEKLDPANASRYRRQAGHLKLDAGEVDAAITLFGELVERDPGSRENLSALALAQQRAGRWPEAVATWERAYRLPGKGSATARGEVRSALLGALKHTGQQARAIELLGAMVEEQTERTARQNAFGELLNYAKEHGRLEAVEQAQAARLLAQPQDPTLLAESAALQRVRGRFRAAYALLERALPVATDPVGALREVVAAAEAAGDLEGAIRHQRRLVQIDPTAGKDSAGWEKLAALEVASLDLDAATQTWHTLRSRFPRDPDLLARAQDFFENVADQPALAREILRKIVAIEPNDLSRLLRLGRLEAAAGGDPAQARQAFEAIIARTGSEGPGGSHGGALLLPALTGSRNPSRLTQVRVAGEETGPPGGALRETAVSGGDEQLRLLAIGELSRLLRQATDDGLGPWLNRWRDPKGRAPLEALWAFYFAGDLASALEVFDRELLLAQPDDARLRRAWLDLVFAAEDSPRLARWLRPETPPAPGGAGSEIDGRLEAESRGRRLTAACEALARYVASVESDTLERSLLDAIFPDTAADGTAAALPREKLWQVATQVLAPAGRLAEATRLGEGVFASSVTGRAACGLQLARWHLTLREPDKARSILRASFGTPDLSPAVAGSPHPAPAATDDEDASLAEECLRLYFLLLPVEERAPFRERFSRAAEARASGRGGAGGASPTQHWISVVLLDGLAGDWVAGRAHLDRLFSQRPLSDRTVAGSEDPAASRRWRFWMELGDRLVAWSLEPLATHLWKRTLADPALVGLGADAVLRGAALREIRARLAAAELNAEPGDPARTERLLRELIAAESPDTLATLRTRFGAGNGSVASSPARFGSVATLPLATRLAEWLCTREPGNAENWRALLNAYTSAGATGPLEHALRQQFFGGSAAPLPAGPLHNLSRDGRDAPLPRRELALRLADLLEGNGDLPAAGRILEIAIPSASRTSATGTPLGGMARDNALVVRLAANLEKQGRLADAARAYREILRAHEAEAAVAMHLARVEDALGQPDRATATLEGALAAVGTRAASPLPPALLSGPGISASDAARGGDEIAVALAKRYADSGAAARAVALAQELLRNGRTTPVLPIAIALAKATPDGEEPRAARSLFEALMRAAREPQARLAAQLALLKNAAPSPRTEPAAFERQLRRLRRLAEDSRLPESGDWQTVRFDCFQRAGMERELEKILRDEWADGRGDRVSGAKLGVLLAMAGPSRRPELAALVDTIAGTPQLDEESTVELLTALEKSEQPALGLTLAERLSRRLPQNVTRSLQYARLLWRAGRTVEAERLLSDLEAGAVVNAGQTAQLASLWRDDLGEPERARGVLLRAVEGDPGMRRLSAPLRRDLARAELARGDLLAAKKLLRVANAASAGLFSGEDLDLMLELLEAQGQLATAGQPGTLVELGLPPALGSRLAAAAFTRLLDSGRAEAARGLVTAQPTLLGAVPAVAARLRVELEKPEAGEAGRVWFIDQCERALAAENRTLANARLAHELASLLEAIALRDLDAPGSENNVASEDRQTAALDQLKRACQLEPAHLPRVRRLGELLAARGMVAAATALAQELIAAPDAAPSDKATAGALVESWEAKARSGQTN